MAVGDQGARLKRQHEPGWRRPQPQRAHIPAQVFASSTTTQTRTVLVCPHYIVAPRHLPVQPRLRWQCSSRADMEALARLHWRCKRALAPHSPLAHYSCSAAWLACDLDGPQLRIAWCCMEAYQGLWYLVTWSGRLGPQLQPYSVQSDKAASDALHRAVLGWRTRSTAPERWRRSTLGRSAMHAAAMLGIFLSRVSHKTLAPTTNRPPIR